MSSPALPILLMVLLSSCVQEGAGFAEVKIFLSRLINPRGLGANGHCCDGRSIFCFSQCDHQLTICLDHADGPQDVQHCAYGKMRTGEVTDRNTVYFSGSIGGVANPMFFPMPSWPGRIKLKVHIVDKDDGNADDFVDFLSTEIAFTPGQPSLYFSKALHLQNRVTLAMEVQVRCRANYFGPRCTTRCVQRDDYEGHYTCDQRTGNKLCLPGWRGSACRDIDRDDCLSQPCQHQGICMQRKDGFNCLCPTHTRGDLCEVNTRDDCQGPSCPNNGTCVELEAGNVCECQELWSGPRCLVRLVACSDLPCLHGSTCLGPPGNVSCVCAEGFTGNFCEEDVDECKLGTASCQHQGTCVNEPGTYSCLCADGFTGRHCEQTIDYCADEPCHFGGTCTSDPTGYTCACAPGRTGMQCEEDIEECESSPCRNGGRCLEGDNGYSCQCRPGFTGSHCEVDLHPCVQSPCQNEATCERNGSHFRCVCGDGFEGTLCEVEVTSRLTLPLYVRGHLGDHAGRALDRHLEAMVRQYGGYKHSHVRVASQPKYVTLQDGTKATEITFSVVINRRTLLRQEQVEAILRRVTPEVLESLLHVRLVQGAPRLARTSSPLAAATQMPTSSTNLPEWYVFVGASLGVALGILIAFLIFRRRESIWRRFLRRQHYVLTGPSASHENKIYFVPDSDCGEQQPPSLDFSDQQPPCSPRVSFSSCELEPSGPPK